VYAGDGGAQLVQTSTLIGSHNCGCDWVGDKPRCPDPEAWLAQANLACQSFSPGNATSCSVLPDCEYTGPVAAVANGSTSVREACRVKPGAGVPEQLRCIDANVCKGTRECNDREMELKLNNFCRDGVIKRVVTSTAEYTQGTEKMAAFMTSFVVYVENLIADVRNCWYVVIAMGPVAGAVISFGFIFGMSYGANRIVWWTLYALQGVLILACIFFAWQAGYLESLFQKLIPAGPDGSFSGDADEKGKVAMAVTDVAHSATSFLQTYRPFGETNESAEDTNEILWTIAFWVGTILTLVYGCLVLALRKQIQLAIELIKEAGRTVRKMKSLLIFPFFTYFWTFALFAYFLTLSMFIFSTEVTMDDLRMLLTAVQAASPLAQSDGNSTNATLASSLTLDNFRDFVQDAQEIASDFQDKFNSSDAAYNVSLTESNDVVRYMFVYHLLGYLWYARRFHPLLSISTEIYLCRACPCQILSGNVLVKY
jgi:hypothetical protein